MAQTATAPSHKAKQSEAQRESVPMTGSLMEVPYEDVESKYGKSGVAVLDKFMEAKKVVNKELSEKHPDSSLRFVFDSKNDALNIKCAGASLTESEKQAVEKKILDLCKTETGCYLQGDVKLSDKDKKNIDMVLEFKFKEVKQNVEQGWRPAPLEHFFKANDKENNLTMPVINLK